MGTRLPYNLVLAGFMGTGKSTAGRRAAEILGRPFVDTDALIEARSGRSIPEFFSRGPAGEAEFRRWESEVCREISEVRGQVMALGGGALLNEDTRRQLESSGRIVGLTANIESLARRWTSAPARPLLAAANLQKILEIMDSRRAHYESLSPRWDTSEASVEAIARRLASHILAWEAVPRDSLRLDLPLGAPPSQPCWVGSGLWPRLGDILAEVHPLSRAAIIAPKALEGRLTEMMGSLRRAGYGADLVLLDGHEEVKTWPAAESLGKKLISLGMDRRSLLIGVGGGTVGDLVGFLAHSLWRGMAHVALPTSLLAMVDASIGGKCGLDAAWGKNVFGGFKFPKAVIADLDALASLPEAEWRSGWGELIKTGMIAGGRLWERLERGPTAVDAELLLAAIKIKSSIVARDPFESQDGGREILNLGHTFGHGLELESRGQIRHGEAVGLGLLAAASLGETLGVATPGLRAAVEAVLLRFGLKTRAAFDPERVFQAMLQDKKRRNGRLRFLVPIRPGEVVAREDPEASEAARGVLETVCA